MIKNSNNKKAHAFKRAAALITAALMAALVFTGCPQTPTVQKVTITITGDEGVTVNEPKILEVAKGTKWNEVKAKVKVSYKDGFEEKGFKLDGANGQDLEDGYAFNENKTVFALSKPKTNISYTVEHLQQNAENNEYTLKETETGTGTTDTMTQAEAKNYTGFTAQEIIQAKIKADGSTVVQIKYNRNIITLKLNLTGGTTDTPLTDGEGGIKLLKGKYGAKVELKNLKKGSNTLDKWEPKLPATFPAFSPDTTYAASWTNQYSITVKGDERTSIPSSLIEIDLEPVKTWNDIKADVQSKVSLKPEWQGGDYKVYEWRLDDENGTKLTDGYQIKSHITVYAVTNYAKFKTNSTKTKIELTSDGKGYTGAAPKGKIIIPDGITEIEDGPGWNKGAFKNCTEISSIKFPQTLTKTGNDAFVGCTGLINVDLSACTSLTKIDFRAFAGCTALKSVDLPASLTSIGDGAFVGCTGLTSISLPASLTEIGLQAFEGCTALTSISLPASLTEIGMGVFAGCTGLKSVNLPASLTKIGLRAFAGCTGLTSAVFADTTGWAVYDNYHSSTGASISSSDLAAPATAARYLREETYNGGYCDKYWKKN